MDLASGHVAALNLLSSNQVGLKVTKRMTTHVFVNNENKIRLNERINL